MKTYHVMIADFAFKTAEIVGAHSSRATANTQKDAMPERYGDGSRPIVSTETERKVMERKGWVIYV